MMNKQQYEQWAAKVSAQKAERMQKAIEQYSARQPFSKL